MAGRYLITGVQLGMIKSFINVGEIGEANKILTKIEEEQFIGDSENLIEKDIRKNG